MSIRTIRRTINKQYSSNGNYIVFVVAVPEIKKLYITSLTAMKCLEGDRETLELVAEYKEKYPEFTIEINDSFFKSFI